MQRSDASPKHSLLCCGKGHIFILGMRRHCKGGLTAIFTVYYAIGAFHCLCLCCPERGASSLTDDSCLTPMATSESILLKAGGEKYAPSQIGAFVLTKMKDGEAPKGGGFSLKQTAAWGAICFGVLLVFGLCSLYTFIRCAEGFTCDLF